MVPGPERVPVWSFPDNIPGPSAIKIGAYRAPFSSREEPYAETDRKIVASAENNKRHQSVKPRIGNEMPRQGCSVIEIGRTGGIA